METDGTPCIMNTTTLITTININNANDISSNIITMSASSRIGHRNVIVVLV